jgi:hypothetical protein
MLLYEFCEVVESFFIMILSLFVSMDQIIEQYESINLEFVKNCMCNKIKSHDGCLGGI